jgi:Dolichyl-phosphate-mannose-protein mannosyltransferase
VKNLQRGADESGKLHPAAIFALLFFLALVLHASLLRLPYFWDEAGYYVPAARDLMLTGSVIPRSTPSNAHPPLVMAYLALWWKVVGFAPLITRIAMLAIAAFSLTGLFLLALRVANFEVACGSTLCTAVYPVFFTQSSLAHPDLAAAGLTFWALLAYAEGRWRAMAVWFSLAVLSKETAILAPMSLLGWELLRPRVFPSRNTAQDSAQRNWLLLLPLIPLALWYAYHYRQTGFIFGNPEFFRYNVQATLHPLRILLAFLMRLWQIVGYLGLYVLTLAALFSMWLPALADAGQKRERIAFEVQFAFLAIIVSYSVALAIVGGAVLARYMLPVVPLVIIVCVSTLRRRVRMWRGVIAIVVLGFVGSLFVNPPYGFSLEDNLAYRDYIVLHQRAENFIEAHYTNARVLTAWPASDELSRSYLGYIAQPVKVFRVEDFTVEQLMSASEVRSNFDAAMVFSTKYEPPHSLFDRVRLWQEWKTRFFGFHRDVPPSAAAQILGGRLVYTDRRNGQWIGVIEMQQIVEAHAQIGAGVPTCPAEQSSQAGELRSPAQTRTSGPTWFWTAPAFQSLRRLRVARPRRRAASAMPLCTRRALRLSCAATESCFW